MDKKKIHFTYHLRKKQFIEHGIGILLDLKLFLAIYMIVGYGIYAVTKNTEFMLKDLAVLILILLLSYMIRNQIQNNIAVLGMQFCLLFSSNFWCYNQKEKIICILFVIAWSIYSLGIRIKENKERTFKNNELVAILIGIPLQALADYYQYESVKKLIFWLGFFMILLHFVIKYMIGFMNYFEQAGQVNVTVKQIKLKSHLVLTAYGVIGMGVMLLMSKIPLQGIWKSIKHRIYLLLKAFFHMLEGKAGDNCWSPTQTPFPTPTATGMVTVSKNGSFFDWTWIGTVLNFLYEIFKVVVTIVIIIYILKLIYTLFQSLNKKGKGIEEEKEFIHPGEKKVRNKKNRKKESLEKEKNGNNNKKVRKLFYQFMVGKGIKKYNNKQYMTSREMCHLYNEEELKVIEKTYQKARYSNETVQEQELEQLKQNMKETKGR